MRRRFPKRSPRPKSEWRVPGTARSSPVAIPAVLRRPWALNRLQRLVVRLSGHGKALWFFVSALVAAYFFGWNNVDLVWGLWTTSFIVGNVAILRGMAGPLVFIRKRATAAEWTKFRQAGIIKQCGVALAAVVLLCWHVLSSSFLALHFSVFSLCQAYVLQILFPHPGLWEAMEGSHTPGLLEVGKILFASYWFVVLQKLLFDRMEPDTADADADLNIVEWIKRPYMQVIRMQLLLFAVIGLNALAATQFLVYTVVFTIFFFPLQIFRRSQAANGA